ncbi:hypothetical protein GSI_06445 [Ganoderma sinense ZZ0214-1]|uniref:Uncharacterized protein n=1 Tax=Ganoderma sinense ZZ0214-1 TaxID=1077348 RepID=A0A2G8SDC6_9APHY|nr:hypothetical protein GSI_06445 [Ganoderma sinense ZZ0214-1]
MPFSASVMRSLTRRTSTPPLSVWLWEQSRVRRTGQYMHEEARSGSGALSTVGRDGLGHARASRTTLTVSPPMATSSRDSNKGIVASVRIMSCGSKVEVRIAREVSVTALTSTRCRKVPLRVPWHTERSRDLRDGNDRTVSNRSGMDVMILMAES